MNSYTRKNSQNRVSFHNYTFDIITLCENTEQQARFKNMVTRKDDFNINITF